MVDIIRLLLIGAGSRGKEAYGKVVLELQQRSKFIAVAEPIQERREEFAAVHKIKLSNQFLDWKPLLDAGIEADAVLVCTQDQHHKEPAIYAMQKGYHVLLEKPMAENLKDCIEIIQTAQKTGKILQVCHVLRYTPFFKIIYHAIESGKLGTIISYTHRENVSHFHMAHSFVRGNWRNSDQSSPMILAKCCHDLDLIYWFVGAKCKKISSFGGLTFFKKENAPPEATKRCVDCPLKDKCEFSAYQIYSGKPFFDLAMNSPHMGILKRLAKMRVKHPNFTKFLSKFFPIVRTIIPWKQWPTNTITEDLTEEGIAKAIAEGPYGRCVWYCDNNVVDHQSISMLFENGITAHLLMHGHSPIEGRSLRIDGTKGTIIADFLADDNKITFIEHGTTKREELFHAGLDTSGHGGGDAGLINAFIELLEQTQKNKDTSFQNDVGLTSGVASFESHLMAFISEIARKDQQVHLIDDYRE
jgi:predicted dehydrogenase